MRYKTNGYYDNPNKCGYQMNYVPFGKAVEKSFDDTFFGEWLESPVAFGAFDGERLIGFAEGSPESWNNRFRISNICVFDCSERGKGTGTMLMNAILDAAKAYSPRMVVLETQT